MQGKRGLWRRQVATGKNLLIVPPARVAFFYGLTFSHDGNYIYYVNQEMNHVGILFQVSSLGGASTKITEDVDSAVTLSPDDKAVAFIRGSPGIRSIIIANVDVTGERKLASTGQADALRWSQLADSAGLVARREHRGLPGRHHRVGRRISDYLGLPDSGRGRAEADSRSLGNARTVRVAGDGSGLLATASDESTNPAQQIWFVPYPQGPSWKVTNGLSDYHDQSGGRWPYLGSSNGKEGDDLDRAGG